jgi:hypothetical protein
MSESQPTFADAVAQGRKLYAHLADTLQMTDRKGEWARWSNCELARRAGVSEFTVRSLRENRSDNQIAKSAGVSHTFVDSQRSVTGNVASMNQETPEKRTFTDRYGNESMMNTAKIGKGKSQPEPVELHTCTTPTHRR